MSIGVIAGVVAAVVLMEQDKQNRCTGQPTPTKHIYFDTKIEAIKYMQDEIKRLLYIKQHIYEEDSKHINAQIKFYQNRIKELMFA